MIGDRRHDLEAALANDISSMGVLWGYGTRNELAQLCPMFIAETPKDMEELIFHD